MRIEGHGLQVDLLLKACGDSKKPLMMSISNDQCRMLCTSTQRMGSLHPCSQQGMAPLVATRGNDGKDRRKEVSVRRKGSSLSYGPEPSLIWPRSTAILEGESTAILEGELGPWPWDDA